MLPLPGLILLSLVARAGEVAPVPSLVEPVSAAAPALAQLRLDVAALQAPQAIPALPVSAVIPAAAFAQVQKAVDAAVYARTTPASYEALRRVEIAQELLRRVDPNEFAKLPQAEQEKAFAKLWDGWKDRGLVADPSAKTDPGGALDRLVLAGVNDRALTSANKSAFLASAVLGYPLEDSLWLQRTRISDALEENALNYPRNQRWHTDDRTPEILGTTKEAQRLVDTWGEATDQAAKAIEAVREAKAARAPTFFVTLVRELFERKDDAALDYLSGRDPTFTAFLMDARKPGYYLYNGERAVVERIMASRAVRAMGIRRVETKEGDNVVPSIYFYRPTRLAERLRELGAGKPTPEDADARRRLAEYAARAAALARP